MHGCIYLTALHGTSCTKAVAPALSKMHQPFPRVLKSLKRPLNIFCTLVEKCNFKADNKPYTRLLVYT